MKLLLIDTSVIIGYLRSLTVAVDYINQLQVEPANSVMDVAELYAGVRDGREKTDLQALLANTTILKMTESIAVQGGLFRRQYGKSHNSGLDDCLIAPTAEALAATLVTLNQKHFPMLTDVLVPYIKS